MTPRRSTTPLLCLLACLVTSPASAHRFAPASLKLDEFAEGRAKLRFKLSLTVAASRKVPRATIGGCENVGEVRLERAGDAIEQSWIVRCPTALAGRSLRIENLLESNIDALVDAHLFDGRAFQAVLRGDRDTITLPKRGSKLAVAGSYARLGVEHILSGFDHLLFVLCLLLLVVGKRALLWTVTAFTLGHSLTLSLATLDLIALPSAPIEAAIALSIFFLALEVVNRERRVTLAQRRPWVVAAAFGLLHGLGFAGALIELGLPQQAIPLALAMFNLGVEIGQLLFIASALALAWATRRLWRRKSRFATTAMAYAIGCCAALFCFQRVAPFF